MQTKSVRGILMAGVLIGAGTLAGCTAETPHANMSVMRAHGSVAPMVTLGAGDALGRQIYMNDLVLASRGVKGAMPDYLTAKPGFTPPALATVPGAERLPGE